MSEQHIEHVFRHEYGLLVATLARKVGMRHLELVEDSVQFAMMKALDLWWRSSAPDSPNAWLYKVAYRHFLTEIRTQDRRSKIEYQLVEQEIEAREEAVPLVGEMTENMLQALFLACDAKIPIESQLVFTLKALLGFDVKEIAKRLYISEANVYKRYSRAKKLLQTQTLSWHILTNDEASERLPQVHQILYLLFTEGYLSSHQTLAIRNELCDEALRLALCLTESKAHHSQETFALVALMYFHKARLNSRLDSNGSLLLLSNQDRELWDQKQILTGLYYLKRSSQKLSASRYQIEANIAAEHCLASSLNTTRWDKIAAMYDKLATITHSPIQQLNRALAIAEYQGPHEGLTVLEENYFPVQLTKSYHWYAVKADLYFRCDRVSLAKENLQLALDTAPSDAIRHLLNQRFNLY